MMLIAATAFAATAEPPVVRAMLMVDDLNSYQKLSERAFQLGLSGELHLTLCASAPSWRGMVSKHDRS